MNNPTPGIPSSADDSTTATLVAPIVASGTLYQLFWRQGSRPFTETKYFHHKGDLRSAIERGKRHCEVMNIRFVMVKPFITIFEDEEKVATS